MSSYNWKDNGNFNLLPWYNELFVSVVKVVVYQKIERGILYCIETWYARSICSCSLTKILVFMIKVMATVKKKMISSQYLHLRILLCNEILCSNSLKIIQLLHLRCLHSRLRSLLLKIDLSDHFFIVAMAMTFRSQQLYVLILLQSMYVVGYTGI